MGLSNLSWHAMHLAHSAIEKRKMSAHLIRTPLLSRTSSQTAAQGLTEGLGSGEVTRGTSRGTSRGKFRF